MTIICNVSENYNDLLEKIPEKGTIYYFRAQTIVSATLAGCSVPFYDFWLELAYYDKKEDIIHRSIIPRTKIPTYEDDETIKIKKNAYMAFYENILKEIRSNSKGFILEKGWLSIPNPVKKEPEKDNEE